MATIVVRIALIAACAFVIQNDWLKKFNALQAKDRQVDPAVRNDDDKSLVAPQGMFASFAQLLGDSGRLYIVDVAFNVNGNPYLVPGSTTDTYVLRLDTNHVDDVYLHQGLSLYLFGLPQYRNIVFVTRDPPVRTPLPLGNLQAYRYELTLSAQQCSPGSLVLVAYGATYRNMIWRADGTDSLVYPQTLNGVLYGDSFDRQDLDITKVYETKLSDFLRYHWYNTARLLVTAPPANNVDPLPPASLPFHIVRAPNALTCLSTDVTGLPRWVSFGPACAATTFTPVSLPNMLKPSGQESGVFHQTRLALKPDPYSGLVYGAPPVNPLTGVDPRFAPNTIASFDVAAGPDRNHVPAFQCVPYVQAGAVGDKGVWRIRRPRRHTVRYDELPGWPCAVDYPGTQIQSDVANDNKFYGRLVNLHSGAAFQAFSITPACPGDVCAPLPVDSIKLPVSRVRISASVAPSKFLAVRWNGDTPVVAVADAPGGLSWLQSLWVLLPLYNGGQGGWVIQSMYPGPSGVGRLVYYGVGPLVMTNIGFPLDGRNPLYSVENESALAPSEKFAVDIVANRIRPFASTTVRLSIHDTVAEWASPVTTDPSTLILFDLRAAHRPHDALVSLQSVFIFSGVNNQSKLSCVYDATYQPPQHLLKVVTTSTSFWCLTESRASPGWYVVQIVGGTDAAPQIVRLTKNDNEDPVLVVTNNTLAPPPPADPPMFSSLVDVPTASGNEEDSNSVFSCIGSACPDTFSSTSLIPDEALWRFIPVNDGNGRCIIMNRANQRYLAINTDSKTLRLVAMVMQASPFNLFVDQYDLSAGP